MLLASGASEIKPTSEPYHCLIAFVAPAEQVLGRQMGSYHFTATSFHSRSSPAFTSSIAQEWAVPTELSRAIVGGKTVAAGAKLLPGKGAPECGRESLFLHSHHAR